MMAAGCFLLACLALAMPAGRSHAPAPQPAPEPAAPDLSVGKFTVPSYLRSK